MFIGHYGLGYVVKKKAPELPLWLLFASVQLLDIIAFTFVLLGIEKASYNSSDNPFFRNHLDLPFSHSLLGAILISLIVFFIFWIKNKKREAWILGLCVLSHWFIDLIVHTNDLPILFGTYKVGFGLWQFPYFAYALEILFVLIGWLLIRRRNVFSYVLLFLMITSFSGMVFRDEPEMMKNNDYLRTSVVLFSNGLFILLAYLSDRKLKKE
ncbi:MAG TPA: hypothetical protein PKK00_05280 [Bacteroidales bacterium]|nr:hypothetical protein [Bacteroidales bacterium]HPS18437.1 hypothetical protein [Bacteroidales bacterium]